MDSLLLRLFNFLILVITASLFQTAQKVKKKNTCYYSYEQF